MTDTRESTSIVHALTFYFLSFFSFYKKESLHSGVNVDEIRTLCRGRFIGVERSSIKRAKLNLSEGSDRSKEGMAVESLPGDARLYAWTMPPAD